MKFMQRFETTTELYGHQIAAVNKANGLRVFALFAEMRTGKTRMGIEFASRRQHKISRVIWVCPVNAKGDIRRQILEHTNTTDVYVFDDKTSSKTMPVSSWYVVGMESVSQSDRVKLCLAHLVDERTCVILDESDMCKDTYAERTRWLTQICEHAKYKLILTGTPALEGVEDLFAQFRFLDWRILGYRSYWTFAKNHLEYYDNVRRGGKPQVKHVLDREGLARKIAPYTYQVTLADIAKEPEKNYSAWRCSMTDDQESAYWQVKERFADILEGDLTVWDVYKLFSGLRAVVSGYTTNKQKQVIPLEHNRVKLLIEKLETINATEPVVIWVTYQHSIAEIRAALLERFGIAPIEFHGGIKGAARTQNLERWHAGARFLLATPYSGGRGLGFHEASHAIFYANDWKTHVRVQAESRIITMNAERSVNFTDLITRDSIDERIHIALSRKENAAKLFHAEISRVKDKAYRRELIFKL